MKKKTYQNILNKPTYLGILLIGLLLLGLLLSLFFRNGKDSQPQISQGQIQIVKGEEVITINQNGLVEYKSKDKTYYETWDASQMNSFFSMMEKKARDYISKRSSGGDCGYKVFMFIDKKLVTVCMDSNDEDLADVIEPIYIKYSDIDLADYFDGSDDSEEDEDEEFDGYVNFPTSTPRITRSTPTPTPYSVYNINTNYAPVKAGCENWSGDIVGSRAIISNTFCTVDSTPTPTP